MKFKKQDLQELAYEDHDEEIYEVILNEIIGTSRWSINHKMIFKFEGKFYHTSYSQGATESQEESPYEYEEDLIECVEVKPVEKVITVYEAIPV